MVAKGIWTLAIISNAEGQTLQTNSNVPNLTWPAERSIAPSAESWARETVLTSNNLVTVGKGLHSNCLSVYIMIMVVDFDDGTSWHLGLGNHGQAGATVPEHIEDAVTCSNATATQSEVDELGGAITASRLSPVRHPPSEEVQSYAFACALKSRLDRTFATCPY
jgi:hypothetical protein